MCKSKDSGGLGIKKAALINKSYMMKLSSRFKNDPNALWAKVLRYKYIAGNSIVMSLFRTHTISLLWRGMVDASD